MSFNRIAVARATLAPLVVHVTALKEQAADLQAECAGARWEGNPWPTEAANAVTEALQATEAAAAACRALQAALNALSVARARLAASEAQALALSGGAA